MSASAKDILTNSSPKSDETTPTPREKQAEVLLSLRAEWANLGLTVAQYEAIKAGESALRGHDALVEALQGLLDWSRRHISNARLEEQARAALQKAGGK